ncbi:hypothetical protein FRUB_09782 [Fimbriiglobus ruber]|uniref:Uncharacterized protein n=2 Tax=Fimbriiglobus ruber TaxID=1908690 RepID=A0A225D004_9BACT|nr:hypothetical protein FRUB_09782 [Fimbriiglobus ruber]
MFSPGIMAAVRKNAEMFAAEHRETYFAQALHMRDAETFSDPAYKDAYDEFTRKMNAEFAKDNPQARVKKNRKPRAKPKR